MANKFENTLKVLNRSQSTIYGVIRKLDRFIEYLAGCGISHVDNITKDIIADYQIKLYQQINYKGYPNCIRYQNSMLSVVKQFLKFLKETEYIVSNPARDIHYAKEPKTLPSSILTTSEARKIIHAPDVKSVIGYRDRTILEVLYSSGIRKTELRDLTLNDVDYHDGFIRVQGKGNRERMVPVGRIACRYLENYIKSVRPELIKDPYNNHVFLSSRGKRFDHTSVWDLVKKYAKKAKIKKNIHCHTFRHTCATAMLKNKAGIRIIQKLLGHASMNTTQIYTHVSITDLKEVHKRCHPRENDKE
jgi:integrase/recombinase XerD